MRTLRSHAARAAVATALALLAACGGDGSSSPDTTAAGVDELQVLSAEAICDTVTVEIVSEALGLDITGAEASATATPQCAYGYESPGGGTSNVTVASMNPTAVGERAGDVAFDFVADVNRQAAGGTTVEEVEVDAGDRAVRFTGAGVHLGVVAVDGHLQTVIVPLDVDPGAVDALLVAVASAIAG
jgi:hypothetical protein